MYFEIDNNEMYYEVIGSGKPLLILHGWGRSHFDFDKIIRQLPNNKIILVDFINFGLSDKSDVPLSLDDYTDHIFKLLKTLEIDNPIILGHSFGGRVAIRYGSRYQVSRLILVSSAGVRPKRTIKFYYQRYKYKLLKKLYRRFNHQKYQLLLQMGSLEYRSLDKVMQKTFSKIVNLDLKSDMKKIKVPTLIIAGVNDKTVPFKDAQTINSLINKSLLMPFYNSGHFPFIDEETKFLRLIEKHLKE